jgi:hypothetical protein
VYVCVGQDMGRHREKDCVCVGWDTCRDGEKWRRTIRIGAKMEREKDEGVCVR